MEANKRLLTDDEMLCASLPGVMCFEAVREAMIEACKHQDAKSISEHNKEIAAQRLMQSVMQLDIKPPRIENQPELLAQGEKP